MVVQTSMDLEKEKYHSKEGHEVTSLSVIYGRRVGRNEQHI
jgi:hypothetical protein